MASPTTKMPARPTGQDNAYRIILDLIVPGLWDFRHTLDAVTYDDDFSFTVASQMVLVDTSAKDITGTLPVASESENLRILVLITNSSGYKFTLTIDGVESIAEPNGSFTSKDYYYASGTFLELICADGLWRIRIPTLNQLRLKAAQFTDGPNAVNSATEVCICRTDLGNVDFDMPETSVFDGKVLIFKLISNTRSHTLTLNIDGGSSDHFDDESQSLNIADDGYPCVWMYADAARNKWWRLQ